MEKTYTPQLDPVPPPSTTPPNPNPPQPIRPPGNYDPNAAKNSKKKILIVAFVWRIFVWVLMVIFFILGFDGVNFHEPLYRDCRRTYSLPKTYNEILEFHFPAFSLVIFETLSLLLAGCLHYLDKCACVWSLDGAVQVVFAVLSGWAGFGLFRIADRRLTDGREVQKSYADFARRCNTTGRTSREYRTPKPPPASDGELKEYIGFNLIYSAGVLAILCGLFFIVTIAVIGYSKPEPKPQQVVMYPSHTHYPLQEQQPMAAPSYYAAPAPQLQ